MVVRLHGNAIYVVLHAVFLAARLCHNGPPSDTSLAHSERQRIVFTERHIRKSVYGQKLQTGEISMYKLAGSHGKTVLLTLLTLLLTLFLTMVFSQPASALSGPNTIDLEDTVTTSGTNWNYDPGSKVFTVMGGADVTVTGSASDGTRIVVEGMATMTLDNASIKNAAAPIKLGAGASLTLVLPDGSVNTLTATGSRAGMEATAGTALVIRGGSLGTGLVTATGGVYGAGIGGGKYGSWGTITISGGTVTATGGEYGAGIGGGGGGEGGGGTITIEGGYVTVTGGGSGAGIGGGIYSTGGTITISGGGVTATGGGGTSTGSGGGAGIGGGYGGSGGTITISGGGVTAAGNSGTGGAGIGGGSDGNGGTITISGGDVMATGGGAGVGGGAYGNGGTITIEGGDITAAGGGYSAGIGGSGFGSGGTITISGGDVTATGGVCGAGIGNGYAAKTTTEADRILIYGEATKVNARNGGYEAQDIGKGFDLYNAGIGVFVALAPGNLTMSDTPAPSPNSVAFSAIPAWGGTITAALPAPFNATVGILSSPGAAAKNLSLITTLTTESISFALEGNPSSPISKTGAELMASGASVAFADLNIIDLADTTTTGGANWTYDAGRKVFTVLGGADVMVTGSASDGTRIVAEGTVTMTLYNASITNAAAPIKLSDGASLTLILADGSVNTLTATSERAGIEATAGTALAIRGGSLDTGKLTATGGAEGAGIGGGSQGSGGTITISGGDVTATGGASAAGIGNGYGVETTTGTDRILIYGEATKVNARNGGDGAQDIGIGAFGSGSVGVFVALAPGNLTLSGTAPNSVTFSATPALAGTITAALPAPFNATVGMLSYPGAAAKNLSLITTLSTESISFAMAGYVPISKTGAELMASGASVAFTNSSIIDLANTATTGGANWTYDAGSKVFTVLGGADVTVTGSASDGTRIVAEGTATVTLDNASITNAAAPIKLSDGASLTLILADGSVNTLTATRDCAGIEAIAGTALVIRGGSLGTGKLNTNGGAYGAGIGGGSQGSGGTITIEGGGGTITISGGDVTATGGYSAAGIGGGIDGNGGTITISGGDVTATGGYGAAGIGGGLRSIGGMITISGGDVTATGDVNGAGIGSGHGGSGMTITISGGGVTATGGESGAGIGGGRGGRGVTITISGGDVTATGGTFSAGIGNGNTTLTSIEVARILIYGEATKVNARAGSYSQDIGKGAKSDVGIGIYVALAPGNLTLSGTTPNQVAFSAIPASGGTITAALPAPFNATIPILSSPGATAKNLSLMTTLTTESVSFALAGSSPVSKTGAELMATGASVAFVKEKEQYYLEVTAVGAGSVTVNGEAISSNYKDLVDKGASITLTAIPDEGYYFAYWQDVPSSCVITTDPTYQTVMGTGINVKAVFYKTKTAESTSYTVVFQDRSGRILQSTNVSKGSDATTPPSPAMVGYTFTGWDKPYTNVTADLTLSPVFVRADETYALTVVNGQTSGGTTTGSCQFDVPVTVTADAAPDGMVFGYWEQDGIKVGTTETYTFFMPMRATTLTAVYVVSGTAASTPFIALFNDALIDTANKTMLFTAVRNVPAGCTLIESGVLLLKANTGLTGELTADTAGAIHGRIENDSTDQFYIRKMDVAAGDTWYARAYLIYQDSHGNIVTVYSPNTVNAVMG
jgi:hypothetical protein